MFSAALNAFKATPQSVVVMDLRKACTELTGRGLLHSAKWAAELLYNINAGRINRSPTASASSQSGMSSTSECDVDSDDSETESRAIIESRISKICDVIEQGRWSSSSSNNSSNSSSAETDKMEEDDDKCDGDYAGISYTNKDFCDPMYIYAKTLFDMREYHRCAFHLGKLPLSNRAGLFLRCYALYLAGERRRNEELSELRVHPATLISAGERDNGSGITTFGSSARAPPLPVNKELSVIAKLLDDAKLPSDGNDCDGFYWYMRSIVSRAMGLKTEAKECLIKSINLFPCNYSAWKDLAQCADTPCIDAIKPHWTKVFLLAELSGKGSLSDPQPPPPQGEACWACLDLCETFPTSTHYLTELGQTAQGARMDLQAARVLEAVHASVDPFCLDKMDVLSNAYFNAQKAPELSKLAQDAAETDKFRAETCIVAGNYFSLKERSADAIRCFDRAAHLDPASPAPLLLLGHESVILKKYSSAIRAYRLAAEVDPADHRAWYGLALAYRDLKQPAFGLYYALKACSICPDDPRMWACAGSYYNALGNRCMALHAFVRAYSYDPGDQGVVAELAQLFRGLGLDELGNGFCELNVENGVDVARSLFFMAKFAERQELAEDALRLYSRIGEIGSTEDRERAKHLRKELQGKIRKAKIDYDMTLHKLK